MNRKYVYVVTDGDYSEYRICAIFTSEELAKKYMESFEKKVFFNDIEKYPLDVFSFELHNGYKPYYVRMDRNGNVVDCGISQKASRFEDDISGCYFDCNGDFLNMAYAKDEAHAIKITNEKRVQLIATNQWNPRNRNGKW